MEWLSDPQIWASLVTLTALEIVLGIDNLVFIAIVAGRLPLERQNRARQVGLSLALITRLALLASIVWIIGLTQPLFHLFGHPVSWRDIILIAGGLFLLYKGTREIHQRVEGVDRRRRRAGGRASPA
jgi:predicted tellurium resistance membrane protein TerC